MICQYVLVEKSAKILISWRDISYDISICFS